MMRSKNTIFLSVFVLLLGLGTSYAVHGQEKADTWFSSLLEMVKPHQKSENNERLQRVIHNINKHEEEVARLQTLGYDELSIQQHFKAQQPTLGSGSISGRVRLKGEGLSWTPTIYVRAYNEYGYYAGGAYIASSDNSQYSVTGLQPGKYYLKAWATGYETRFFRKASDWTKAKLINVQDGKNIGGKNFVLQSNKGKGSISGQIKGQDGTKLSECNITAYGEDYRYNSSASTDENGVYKIEGLKSGKYRLHCRYHGPRSFIHDWYDDKQSYESATEVKVSEPNATIGINFVLDVGGTIKGKVICASGKKAGNYCRIYAYDKKKNIVESGRTDEKLKFTISNLKKGTYKLFVSYGGPENNLDGWYRGAKDFKHAKKIQVNPNKTKNVQIKLKPGGAISGKVVDYSGQPLPFNCSIDIYDESHKYVAYARTDINGDYSVMCLPTGRYKLYARYQDYSSSVGSQPIDEWYDGKYIFKDAALVQVYAPQTTHDINFSLDQGSSISGRVEIPDEYPNYLDECWVRAYDKQGDFIESTKVMYNRQFFISGLRSGGYKLLVDHEDYAEEWYDRKQNIGLADTIRVTAPNTTQGINFTLEYPGIIQGFLTDNKGNRLPSEDYLISIYAYNPDTGEYESTGSNSFTGGYQVRLLSGDYNLAAVSFYSNWQPEQDSLAATFYPNGKSFYDPSNETINLTENSVRKLNTLVMKKTSGAISGILFDESTGLPLEDESLMFFAFDEDGYLVKVSAYWSDPMTGEYKLMGLRPGNYYVVASVWEWAADEITFLWYGSTSPGIATYELLSPKVEIPADAYAVIVGEGETKEIDFYIKR